MSTANRLEKFWYSDSPFKWLLWPLSFLISLVARLKRNLHKLNLTRSYRASVPIVVVGNITVGGTGKTPLITYLVNSLEHRGLSVGIVSRGYKSKVGDQVHYVSTEDSVDYIGDEAFMQARLVNAPIVIGANRSLAVKKILEKHDLDLIISDDGLQHYQLARDYEILLVDGTREFGNRLMLPFGPLREPVSRIKEVDQIVVNSARKSSRTLSRMGIDYLQSEVVCSGLIHIKSGQSISLVNLKENVVAAVVGIGNPGRFFKTLSEHCTKFSEHIFDDHHSYLESDFESIKSDIIVMTEKDAVKCKEFAKDNWYYLKIEVQVAAVIVDNIIEKLKLNQKLENDNAE